MNECIDQRLDANKEILAQLSTMVQEHPELRFIQILWHLGIVDKVDRFYEEPTITLNRMHNIQERDRAIKENFKNS